MIWIDSSFAIEWLLGTKKAASVPLSHEPLSILPLQYIETLTYFFRREVDPLRITNEMEGLELKHPEKLHLPQASLLYLEARKRNSKASLADALLATVAQERGEKIASFDHDFAALGFKLKGGFWLPQVRS